MKLYSATTGFQTVTNAAGDQDLLEITAGSARSIRIHEVIIGQTSDYGDTESEGLQIRLLRYSGGFAAGSGGTSTIGADPYTIDDLPTVDAVVDRNHSTPAAVSAGQEDILLDDAMNVQAGWHWLPPPELRVDVAATDAFCVRLVAAPTDDLTMCCTVIFEEL